MFTQSRAQLVKQIRLLLNHYSCLRGLSNGSHLAAQTQRIPQVWFLRFFTHDYGNETGVSECWQICRWPSLNTVAKCVLRRQMKDWRRRCSSALELIFRHKLYSKLHTSISLLQCSTLVRCAHLPSCTCQKWQRLMLTAVLQNINNLSRIRRHTLILKNVLE